MDTCLCGNEYMMINRKVVRIRTINYKLERSMYTPANIDNEILFVVNDYRSVE